MSAWVYDRLAPTAAIVEVALVWPSGLRSTMRGRHEHNRWYSVDGLPLTPGEYSAYAWRPLDEAPPLEAPPPVPSRQEALEELRSIRPCLGDVRAELLGRAIAYLEAETVDYERGYSFGKETAAGEIEELRSAIWRALMGSEAASEEALTCSVSVLAGALDKTVLGVASAYSSGEQAGKSTGAEERRNLREAIWQLSGVDGRADGPCPESLSAETLIGALRDTFRTLRAGGAK